MALARLTAGILGVWFGLQTLRTFFAVIVWNLREHLSPAVLVTLVALTVAAGLCAPLLKSKAAIPYIAAVLGLCTIARQFTDIPAVRIAFALAATILWLWWLYGWMSNLGPRRIEGGLSIVAAFAADAAVHNALHGLDMLALTGFGPLFVMAGLGGLFALTSLLSAREIHIWDNDFVLRRKSEPLPDAPRDPAWNGFIWAPFLFLQLSLLSNTGRIQILGEIELLPATFLILSGLLLGTLLPHWTSLLCPLAVGALLLPALPPTMRIVLLVLAQIGASAGLMQAFSRPAALKPAAWMVGPVLFFALAFLFYCPPNYSWPPLWLVAAVLIATVNLIPRAEFTVAPRPTFAILSCFLLAFDATIAARLLAVPKSDARPPAEAVSLSEPSNLRVLTYNIHHGFDAHGMPAIERQAAYIERQGADLIALQEVGRGDSDNGGVDLVTFLKHRLPEYEVVYGHTSDELSGNTILSRLPIRDSGSLRFPQRGDRLRRGLTWVEVDTTGGPLRFASTHLTVYSRQGREAQAGDLLNFWNRRPCTIIAGDMNAVPGQFAMRRLRDAGLVDTLDSFNLDSQPTSPAANPKIRIDYIWASPDIGAKTARISRVLFSDHLPVQTELQLRLPARTGIARMPSPREFIG